MGKKILVSIGGDTPEVLQSTDNAQLFAEELFLAYGPKVEGYTGPRPFGDAVVDGFDVDIEKVDDANFILDFARQLRYCMDNTSSRTKYLSGAPQCVVPDAQLATAIAGTRFDFLYVCTSDAEDIANTFAVSFNSTTPRTVPPEHTSTLVSLTTASLGTRGVNGFSPMIAVRTPRCIWVCQPLLMPCRGHPISI